MENAQTLAQMVELKLMEYALVAPITNALPVPQM
jgi:hypothetical protein